MSRKLLWVTREDGTCVSGDYKIVWWQATRDDGHLLLCRDEEIMSGTLEECKDCAQAMENEPEEMAAEQESVIALLGLSPQARDLVVLTRRAQRSGERLRRLLLDKMPRKLVAEELKILSRVSDDLNRLSFLADADKL
jgi:hypothetical protein